MKSVRFLVLVILVVGITFGASAQATRTWVSGVGDDVNPCSRTAPCKTFAGAISKTATNGYIHVLDPGGFGTLNITKSITVDGRPFMAGALASLTTGFIINGAGINVTIRNIDIEGANNGINGIRILNASKVLIEGCNIHGFNSAAPNGNGISLDSGANVINVVIRDTTIHNNIRNGIRATTTSILNKLMLDNVRIYQNGQNGVDLLQNILTTVDNSTIAQNGASGILFEQATSNADIYNSVLDNNGAGITTAAVNQARIFGSQITHNTTSISSATGVQTHGNNAIVNNATNTLPSVSVAPAAANGQQ
jgi:Right handed beta helix region